MALAEQQVAAVRGRRDEVDMFAIRMFAATYRGRMKEAARARHRFAGPRARAQPRTRAPATP